MEEVEGYIKEDGRYTSRIFDRNDRLVFASDVPFDYVSRVFNERKKQLQEELEKIEKEIEEL